MLTLAEALLSNADTWIAQHPTVDPRTSPDFEQSVGNFLKVVNHSMLVRLVNLEGVIYPVPADPNAKAANIADRDYFMAALANPPGAIQVSSPYIGRATGKRLISIATRLSKPYGNVAVIYVAIELPLFEQAFELSGLPLGGAISLVRTDGTLLTRLGTKQASAEMNYNEDDLFTKGLVAADRGAVTGTIASTSEQRGMLRSYKRVSGFPVVIAVEQPVVLMEQQSWQVIRAVGIALGLLTLVGIAALWISLRLLLKLSLSRSALSTLANQDHLTGIMNRRRFLEVCDDTLTHMRRNKDEHSLVIADLDNFKKINDTYGHPAGDQALKLFASTCKAFLRETDYVGRLGGEEFGMLLTHIDVEGASQLVERLRQHVSDQSLLWHGVSVQITASFGISPFLEKDVDVNATYSRSDAAMYDAKSSGRNCIRVITHLTEAVAT